MELPVEGQRRFLGVIEGVEGETLVLNVDEVTVRLPLAGIRKARLAPEFDGARLLEG
jgi:ribosome maturation factor RimP